MFLKYQSYIKRNSFAFIILTLNIIIYPRKTILQIVMQFFFILYYDFSLAYHGSNLNEFAND